MRLPRFLTENWGLKLFSLALGVVIFLAVRHEQKLSSTIAVRLVVEEPPDLVNTGEVPPEAIVRLRGPWGTLRSFRAEELPPLEVDLTGLPRGVSTVRLREEQLGLPPDVEVISLSPSALTVRLEVRERRTVPIRPTLRGEPAAGHALGKAIVEPVEVEIEGPRREVREVAAVRTAPVDVAGAREDVLALPVLEPPGQHTRIPGGGRVSVRVPVTARIGERSVRVQVDGPGGAQAVIAVLRGPVPVLDGIDEASLRGRVEGRRHGPLPVRIEGLPEGVVVSGPPPTVPRPRR